jgi:general secretion pathway protein D
MVTIFAAKRVVALSVIVSLTMVLAACAVSRAYSRGMAAARAGDWDAAVEYYRQALQDDPDRAEYKVEYERATFAAAAMHADRAKKAEDEGRLEEALREYRRSSDLDPSNRHIAAKAAELERTIRERVEAARPRPQIEKLREEAGKTAAEPLLNPTSPLGPVRFNNANARDVLNFIGESTGINVIFDRDFTDRPVTINEDGGTLEGVLQRLMITNQMFYKVLNERTILVINDTAAKRAQFEDQVVRTFFLSHADAQEMNQLLTSIIRIAGMPVAPTFSPNKTANTLTVRASAPVMNIIERMLEANDKPRAEVIIDVQILEISRERAKQYGLNLSAYAINVFFSPEVAPTDQTPSFNLNTISQGISTADFYLAVPSALIRFLESDSRTKVLAKPQLRGTEGQKVSLNLGEEVPIPTTTFQPLATGGAATSPLTSYGYRNVGINVEMTPRVTYDGDIMLDLTLENSARGGDVIIAGQALPAFNSRKVATRLRLRDGESNLLAGLLREDERRSLTGFPGLLRMPVIQQLFGNNDSTIRQTDIVMLLTPRIVRSHELTATDLSPIYIGPQSNLSLGGGPPPLINPPASEPAPAVPPPPPGASPMPGLPSTPPAQLPPPTQTQPAPVPPTQAQPAPVPPPAAPEPVAPAPPPFAPVTQPPSAPSVARVTLGAAPEMRVGAGPYTVPVSIVGASRLSTISISISYNPAVLRVRSVQEGTFMRQGGITPAFTQQVDAAAGRIDIAITRPGDLTGAVGSGLLAAVLFEPVATGQAAVTMTGVGSVVGGGGAALQFAPSAVIVK